MSSLKPATKRTVLADEFIASPQFRTLAMQANSGQSVISEARRGVEDALNKSQKYKKWADTLSDAERSAISKYGISKWLFGDEDE